VSIARYSCESGHEPLLTYRAAAVGRDDSVFRLSIPFAQFGKYFPGLGHFLESVPISWHRTALPTFGIPQHVLCIRLWLASRVPLSATGANRAKVVYLELASDLIINKFI
jgi:hypothetical protein